MNQECSIHNCNQKVLHRGYMVQVENLIIKLNLCQEHFDLLNRLMGVKIAYGSLKEDT